ncbi:protein translocase subunit SecD [Planctomicrobium sp. SH661]|uniref:protein translocase subunit SecD n=1 Tax=Planctomicrobium sp. SH661 TaxID=3448124 RepID=UPI003F5B29CA
MNSLSMNLLLAAGESTIKAGEAVATKAAEGPASATAGWLVMLIVLAIVVVPFVLGSLIARALKMRDYATKIGIVLFTLTLALGPFVTRWATGQSPLSAISLGIDLAGGTNMVFAVNKEEAEKAGKVVNADIMNKMVAAVSRRVNPTGTEEVTVRKVGADRLEVIVPGADEDKKNQTKRMILDLGKLEFALLANRNEADHATLIDLASKQGPEVDEVYRNKDLVGKWRPSAVDSKTGETKVNAYGGEVTRTVKRNGKDVTQFLVAVDPDPQRRITGELLKGVREQVSEKGLAVGFTFNDRGGYLMQQMTSKYQPREGAGYKNQLAVLLNEQIHSAPSINAVIGSSGIIEGSFTQEEIDELISVLNAGALQVPLYPTPVSEFTVSPTLGTDVQRKGIFALAIATVAVFVVTLGYYLALGFVADICLALNVILVLGAMALIDATFTLPGLAGLVLSIGMAVDSNVLIFERMREERQRGSSVRLAIKNGFEKAFSTIFDSNVTTLITAVVLYYIGTDQVKGFAVTLFIGIVISMFTAVYVGRIIFDIAERKGWLTDLKMFSVIPTGRVDFMGKKKLAVGISLAVMIAGLLLVGARGRDNLDIDFRGGSMVTFKFEGDTPTSEEVRDALGKKFEKSLALERLLINEAGSQQILFRMRTIESNADVVSKNIVEAFSGTPYKLVQQHLDVSEVKEIPKTAAAAADGEVPATPAVDDDFAGGHEFNVKITQEMLPLSITEEVVQYLRAEKKLENIDDAVVAAGMDQNDQVKVHEVNVKLGSQIPAEAAQDAANYLKAKFDGAPYFDEMNTFDTSVAQDTQMSAIFAIILSLLAIIAYLWVRFQRVSYGLAACIALLHDVLITLGLVAFGALLSGNPIGQMFGLEDFKINLTVVAAFLTIIGYSLNDTIVVFDRIREVRGRNPQLTEKMINQSLNETLSRTLLTSMTTLVVVIIMYCIGGDGIHAFAYCLTLGILVGTFSSIYIAAPVLLWLANWNAKRALPAS